MTKPNRLNGGQVIIDYLIRENVPYVFGLCGHGNIGLIDAMHERLDDIKTISVHHESVAGFMADVYYRVSGQPTATGQVLEFSVGLTQCLDALRPHWQRLRAEAAQSNRKGARRRGIGIGMWLGIIMMLNVWGIIWPNQKKALGIVEAGAEARTVPRVHHGSISGSETLEGPALVISSTTTLWLPEGSRLRADGDGTLIIDPGTP